MVARVKCSAVLCVLNEANSLQECLDHLHQLALDEIVVVDGGSIDGTLEILHSDEEVKVLELPGEGLLRQRLAGIKSARNKYVLLIDVDDSIETSGLQLMLEVLKKQQSLDGVQFRLKAPNGNFWERGWSSYFSVLTPMGKRLKLLGRPSIAKRENFLLFDDPPRGVFGEDTWIHLQESREIRHYEVGPAFSMRQCPASRQANFLQFKRYGQTDSDLASTLSEHLELLFHAAIRIAILRSSRALFYGNFVGFTFIFLLGMMRAAHHLGQWSRGLKPPATL